MLRGSFFFLLALVPGVALAFAPSQTAQWTRMTSVPTSLATSPAVDLATPSIGWKPLYMAAAVSEGDEEKSVVPPGSASVTELCFNLIKGIVGAGVLSLPAGISAFANAPSAVLPAVALIATIGGLSGYGFALIGRCCAYTNTKSYRDAWSATVGKSSSWIPAVAVTFKTFCALLAYSMILGDTFVSLFATAGLTVSKIPTLLGLTGGILLPLCLLKNLSSLAPFSLVGSLGMLYTAVAMGARFVGKSYVAPAGKFAMDCAPALRPAFGSVGAEGILTPSAAILVGMLSTAYMAHFNAPKVSSTVVLCSQH
jgi:amino acid permease